MKHMDVWGGGVMVAAEWRMNQEKKRIFIKHKGRRNLWESTSLAFLPYIQKHW